MTIGILKESENEKRVALMPEHVAALVKLNSKVVIEKNSGFYAFAPDIDYQTAGGEVTDREKVISSSQILVVVSMPSQDTINSFSSGQILIGCLNPLFNSSLVEKIASKGVTSFSLDFIPRSTRGQAMDVLSSMATVSGYKAVLDAALRSPRFFHMFMSAAGTIKPAKVLILGAGVSGLQAVATARKLGAIVEVFDVRSAVKEEVKSLGGKFIEVEGAREEVSAGGYAVEQTEEFRKKQYQLIQDHAKNADVIICTAQIPGKNAPILISKDTIEIMKAGSIVIDIAASSGGNCELTENEKIIEYKQVTIIGKSEYPSDMSCDSSRMFGNNILNFLKLIIDKESNIILNYEDEIIAGTCITKGGQIVNEKYKRLKV